MTTDDITDPPVREEFEGGFAYPNLRLEFDEDAGIAALTVVGPANHECFAPDPGPFRLRSRWWPLAVCRELDDALDVLGSHRPGVHTIELRTEGDPLAVASADVALTCGCDNDPFVREVVSYWRRTLCRLDAVEPSLVARVEPGSCFVGTLFELALAARQTSVADTAEEPVGILLTGMNFGPLPQASGRTRLESRFPAQDERLASLAGRVGDPISAAEAVELGLADELRGSVDDE